LPDTAEFRIGRFTLNPRRQLLLDGAPVPLGRKALDLLSVLAEARGALVTKDELMAAVWPNAIVEDYAIQVHVGALRKALGKDAGLLRTVHGLGYRLAPAGPAVAPRMDVSTPSPNEPSFARPNDPLLAVLAFDNLSSDRGLQFFSDGVSEELLLRLMRGTKLKVVGRTSSFQFRGANKSVRKVAAELSASHILDGSVRRAAGTVRISVHLVEAASQTTLWSDRYDHSLENIFAVQDEIAERIASALDRTFQRTSPAAIDPEVYELYLRGIEPTFDPREIEARTAMLEEVTRRAPHFADAWGRLANAGAWQRFFLPYSQRAANAKTVSARAARALSLDPHNTFARSAQFALLPPYGQFLEGEVVAEQLRNDALGLAPDMLGVSVGRVKAALEGYQRLFARDPLNRTVMMMVGFCQWHYGRYTEARATFETLLALQPDHDTAAMDLILLAVGQEDWATVDAMLAPARLARYPLHQFERLAAGYADVMRDPSPGSRRRPIEAARRRFERTGRADLLSLAWAAELGAVEEVFEIAEKASFGPAGDSRDTMGVDAYRTDFLFHAMFPAIRRDPRFVRLCARLGLVEYWTATQKWPDCADQTPYDFRAECEKARAIPKQAFGF
jgi:TolB-like protein